MRALAEEKAGPIHHDANFEMTVLRVRAEVLVATAFAGRLHISCASSRAAGVIGAFGQQVNHRDPQSIGENFERTQCHVSLAAFD